jgi:hypothetical protein
MEFKPLTDDKLMSNGIRNLSIPQRTEQSLLLTRKAKIELMQNGTTDVICPKCKSKPKIVVNTRERYIFKCECGDIGDYEIYL